MRKNKLFLMPLIAATLSLGSCSSDSPDMGGNDNTFKGDQAFMKVRIGMANDPGTRADGGFENGSTEEQAIKTLGFKFYKEDGSFYTYGRSQGPITPDGSDQGKPTTNNVEAIANAVISLDIKEGDEKPKYVVAYINCGENDEWRTTPEPALSDITKTIESYGNISSGYAMTSSNNSSACYQTQVAPEKFKETEEDAKAENVPVDIYVERVAAKITVTLADNLEENNNTITKGEYSFKFNVKGFGLGGTNKKSYLIKNLDPTWSTVAPWPNWELTGENSNYPYRCFWAKDINYDYKDVGKDSEDNYILDYSSYNTANQLPGNYIYCHENTFTNANGSSVNPYLVQPFAYVTGLYSVTTGTGNTKVTEDLFNYKGLIYTTPDMIDNMQNLVGAVLYRKTSESPETFEQVDLKDLVEIAAFDSNNLILRLSTKEGNVITDADLSEYWIKTVTENGETDYTNSPNVEDVNKILAGSQVQADGFKYDKEAQGHLVYFPVLIEHLNYNPATTIRNEQPVGAYGIVRNHIYRLEINSIKNLGRGVFDPTIDIIPSDTKIVYLGAKIRILSWKVVNQKVDL